MIRAHWRPIVVGLAAGILGVFMALAGAHVWADHWAIHATAAKVQQLEQSQSQIVAWINAVQKAQQGK